ncbi:MAG: type I-E CRISPR-associated endoribonuclease Cas2 [Clostridiales bacterium]|nr:type I-E CRISPR-associated endoribonuclease Cas2 [Clostridiales bacterium]
MLVITLTDCPAVLRGDLTQWLQEISTGVYVGQVGARIREQLWKRIQENIKTGRATMVFSADNEQRMDFRVYNTSWEPIDFDGLKLMLRPSPKRTAACTQLKTGFSNAAKAQMARRAQKRQSNPLPDRYAVIDLETTGLNPSEHEIIELAALAIEHSRVLAEFHTLVKPHKHIPQTILDLTGITVDQFASEGRELSEALPEFLAFLRDMPIVSHNAAFDLGYIRTACASLGLPLFSARCIDTLALARQLLDDVENYKLSTLLAHFGIRSTGAHRAAADCHSAWQLYEKLIEIKKAPE